MSDAPLFHRALGAALNNLPKPIVAIHDIPNEQVWRGRVTVERGVTRVAGLAELLMRFPTAGVDQPLTVRMRRMTRGEEWARRFGDLPMTTRLGEGPEPGTIVEGLWPFAATWRLVPDAAGVTHMLHGFGVLGLPVLRALWPRLDVREASEGDRYTFQMRIEDPWGRLVIAYRGWLDPSSAYEPGAGQ